MAVDPSPTQRARLKAPWLRECAGMHPELLPPEKCSARLGKREVVNRAAIGPRINDEVEPLLIIVQDAQASSDERDDPPLSSVG